MPQQISRVDIFILGSDSEFITTCRGAQNSRKIFARTRIKPSFLDIGFQLIYSHRPSTTVKFNYIPPKNIARLVGVSASTAYFVSQSD